MTNCLLIFNTKKNTIRDPFKEEEIFYKLNELVFYFLSSNIDNDFKS
jgi:hypothetical protein